MWHSGLRIWCYHCSGLSCLCGAWKFSYAEGSAKKKKIHLAGFHLITQQPKSFLSFYSVLQVYAKALREAIRYIFHSDADSVSSQYWH